MVKDLDPSRIPVETRETRDKRFHTMQGTTIYNYETGELLRAATAEERARYETEIEIGDPVGAVPGAGYGFEFTIYMID